MRTIDRYVYHPPWEPNPHPYASGGENVVTLGAIMDNPIASSLVRGFYPQQPGRTITPVCPAWGCGGPPINRWVPTDGVPRPIMSYPPYGSTNTVPQPPPPSGPIGSPVVPVGYATPMSPAPAPTVAVSATQTAPQLTQPGTTLDSSGASISTASGIGAWFGESTLISGIPNWGLAAAGLAAVMMFMGKSGRR